MGILRLSLKDPDWLRDTANLVKRATEFSPVSNNLPDATLASATWLFMMKPNKRARTAVILDMMRISSVLDWCC